jgi:hypothetical protein
VLRWACYVHRQSNWEKSDLNFASFRLGELLDHSGGNTSNKASTLNILVDNRSSSNCDIIPDCNTWEDGSSSSNPTVVTNCDWVSIFAVCLIVSQALIRIGSMRKSVDLDIGC